MIKEMVNVPDGVVSGPYFFNIFPGEFEPFVNEREQTASLLKAAAQRIAEQKEEIDRIKAHLVLD